MGSKEIRFDPTYNRKTRMGELGNRKPETSTPDVVETLRAAENALNGYEERIPEEHVEGEQVGVKGGRYKCQNNWFRHAVAVIDNTRDNILLHKGSDEEARDVEDKLRRYSSIFISDTFHYREKTTPEQIELANEALRLCLVELEKLSK
jgi:hypothetical protein